MQKPIGRRMQARAVPLEKPESSSSILSSPSANAPSIFSERPSCPAILFTASLRVMPLVEKPTALERSELTFSNWLAVSPKAEIFSRLSGGPRLARSSSQAASFLHSLRRKRPPGTTNRRRCRARR